MAWQDEYREHELWNAVSDALEQLAQVPATDFSDQLGRLQALLTDISGHADQPHSALTDSHLTAVMNIVVKFVEVLPHSPDSSIFDDQPNNRSSNSPLTQLAQHVRTWPATGSTTLQGLSSKAAQVEAAFKTLSTRLEVGLTEVEAQTDEQSRAMASSLEEHKEHLEEQRAALEAQFDEKSVAIKEEFEELRGAVSETDAAIEQQKTRLDTALTSHQEKFSASQDERTEKWSALLANNEANLQQHLSKMRKHEERSQNVLSAIGVNSTATHYGTYANDQAKAANRWRIGAVVALSLAALAFLVAAGASFFGYGTELDWWQVVLQKIGAPAGAAAVGYVLIRESGQHRDEERSARQVQLTLTALEPFIANLPEAQKELIRIETARGIFTEQRTGAKTSSAETVIKDGTSKDS